jgi:hypothetical protein
VSTGGIAGRVSGICLAGKFGAVVVSIGGVAQFCLLAGARAIQR